jgi:hypothetical protein
LPEASSAWPGSIKKQDSANASLKKRVEAYPQIYYVINLAKGNTMADKILIKKTTNTLLSYLKL